MVLVFTPSDDFSAPVFFSLGFLSLFGVGRALAGVGGFNVTIFGCLEWVPAAGFGGVGLGCGWFFGKGWCLVSSVVVFGTSLGLAIVGIGL